MMNMRNRTGERFGNYRLLRPISNGAFADTYLGEHIHLHTLATVEVLHAQLEEHQKEEFREQAPSIARQSHPDTSRVLDFGIEGSTPFLVVGNTTSIPRRFSGPSSRQQRLDKTGAGASAFPATKVLEKTPPVGRTSPITDPFPENLYTTQQEAYEQRVSSKRIIPPTRPRRLGLLRLPPTALSRRTLLIGGLIGLAGIGTGLTWLTLSRLTSPQRPAAPAISPTLPTRSLAPGTVVATYTGHQNNVNELSWSPDGRRIVTGSEDATAHVWEAATGKHLLTYKGHNGYISVVAWSPDGKAVASGGEDTYVHLWDPTTGNTRFVFQGQFGTVLNLGWSPDNQRIASGGSDGVKIWDAFSGKHLLAYEKIAKTANLSIFALAWSPDGTRLVSSQVKLGKDISVDPANIVHVGDAATGQIFLTYPGHGNVAVNVTDWSPDGNYIVTGSDDATAQIWSSTNGHHLLTYQGHRASVRALAWSPDGRYIASGSADTTILIWDAATGQTLYTYQRHQAGINALHWSPDGKYIASASDDKTAHVWRAV